MSHTPLRLMIFDKSCRGRGLFPGLSHSWELGAWLYGRLGRLDDWKGFDSWNEALTWLAEVRPESLIAEIQFWGHGKWGSVRMGDEPMDISSLDPAHPHFMVLKTIRKRFLPHQKSRWWFRSCETFGAKVGLEFAESWAAFFQSKVAGHTYIIGPAQSGLHVLRPGEKAYWSAWEGLLAGSPEEPLRAKKSRFWRKNTLSCLHGSTSSYEKKNQRSCEDPS